MASDRPPSVEGPQESDPDLPPGPATLVLHADARNRRKDRQRQGKRTEGDPIVIDMEAEGVLVPPRRGAENAEGPGRPLKAPVVCGECQGPLFLCQGRHDGPQGQGGPDEQRIVAGLRAVYIAALLHEPWLKPADLFGGALLIAAQAALRSPVPHGAGVRELAAILADPCIPRVSPFEAAALAHEAVGAAPNGTDFDKLKTYKLRTMLVGSIENASDAYPARYLRNAWRIARDASVASPLTHAEPWDLVSVLCDTCAADQGRMADRFCGAEEYDDAVACPSCGVEHAHPFAWEQFIHPVARCYGNDETGCLMHKTKVDPFLPLSHGICAKGKTIYERAYAAIATTEGRERLPWEDRLLAALARARRREENLRIKHEVEPMMQQFGRFLDKLFATGPQLPPAPPSRRRRRASGTSSK